MLDVESWGGGERPARHGHAAVVNRVREHVMPAARSKPPPAASVEPLRAYLAGPEVFLQQAAEIAACKKRLCAEHGMVGICPIDNQQIGRKRSRALVARAISAANEALIRGCDLLIANCSPFRGVSMDAGTAYEIGYARALGKPVFGYSNVIASYKQRADRYRRLGDPLNADAVGSAIEDFGLADNLMLATSLTRELVRTRVERGREIADQRGFARCVLLAVNAMRVGQHGGELKRRRTLHVAS
jgi:nucleoside 2-deoxyribosyltransferase